MIEWFEYALIDFWVNYQVFGILQADVIAMTSRWNIPVMRRIVAIVLSPLYRKK